MLNKIFPQYFFAKKNTLLVTLIFACSFILVFSNKSFLFIFALFFLYLFFVLKKDLLESSFFTMVLALPFERGIRDWQIYIVQPGPERWLEGYFYYFTFSPKMMFALLSVLLAGVWLWRQKGKRAQLGEWRWFGWLLLSYILIFLVSVLFSQNIGISLLALVRNIVSLSYFFIGFLVLQKLQNTQLLLTILTGLVAVLGIVGMVQFGLERPWGLFLEETAVTSPQGYITTDGAVQFRSVGFLGHPTFYGAFLVNLLVFPFLLLLQKNNQKWQQYLAMGILLVGSLGTLASMSRSSWFVWMCFVVIGTFILYQIQPNLFRFSKKTSWIAGAVASLVVLIASFGSEFLVRAQTFLSVFDSANWEGRLNLVNRALQMIEYRPIWGVGPNLFTYQMNQFELSLQEETFLKPVHNVWLLLASENGLLQLIPLTLLAGYLLVSFVTTLFERNWQKIIIFLPLVGFAINSQFHALYLHDPNIDLVCIVLALIAVNENSKNVNKTSSN